MILQTLHQHLTQTFPQLQKWHTQISFTLTPHTLNTQTATPTTITITQNPKNPLGPQLTLTLNNTTLTIKRRIIIGPTITTHHNLDNPNSIEQIEQTIKQYLTTCHHTQTYKTTITQ